MVLSTMPSSTSVSRYSSYSSYPSYRSSGSSSSSSSSLSSSYLNRTTSLERSNYGSSYYTGCYNTSRYSGLPPRPSYSTVSDSYRSSRSLRVSPVRSSYSSRISTDSGIGSTCTTDSKESSRYSVGRFRDSSASRDSSYVPRYSTRDRSSDIINGNGLYRRPSSQDRSRDRRKEEEDDDDSVKVSDRVRAFEVRRDSTEERLAQRRRRLGLSPTTDSSSRRTSYSRKTYSEDNGNDSEDERPSVSDLCKKYGANLNLTNGVSRSDGNKSYNNSYETNGCSGGATSSFNKDIIEDIRPDSPDRKYRRRTDSYSKDESKDSTVSSAESILNNISKATSPVSRSNLRLSDTISDSAKETKVETSLSSYANERDSFKAKSRCEPSSVTSRRDSTESLLQRSRERRDRVKDRIAARLANEVEDVGDETPSRKRSPTRGSVSSFSESNGLVGLRNIGNTCFLNSITQCLSNTRCLMEYLVREGYSSDINSTALSTMKGDLVRAFANLLIDMWREGAADSRSPINTGSFKSHIQRFAPVFIGYAQHDAQEFLRKLLEGLHEDVNRVTERPRPILEDIDETLDDNQKAMEAWKRYIRYDDSKIVDMFVGQLKSSLQCSVCGHRSVTFDPFWDLSLPIPSKTGQVKLTQCLDLFTKEEVLDNEERPTCSKCKERRKMTKSFSIQKFPKVLVLHLKRFSPHERWRGKLTGMVEFPLVSLDLSRYAACTSISSQYRLISVANHSGTALSGHYTAYCRHPYNDSWHEYNDSRVCSISSNRVCSPEAYVLFYEHCSS